ncbi:unnamed protein product, partial [Prorocentrum cordatum]
RFLCCRLSEDANCTTFWPGASWAKDLCMRRPGQMGLHRICLDGGSAQVWLASSQSAAGPASHSDAALRMSLGGAAASSPAALPGSASVGALRAEPVLAAAVSGICDGLEEGIEKAFWSGLQGLIEQFGPRNAALLQKRADMQRSIDAWHAAHPEASAAGLGSNREYVEFLRGIGYLQGPAQGKVEASTCNVDPEIGAIAGPQLVCPIDKARFVLNSCNARWGSLFDATYASNILGPAPSGPWAKARALDTIAFVDAFLSKCFPLRGLAAQRQWEAATGLAVRDGQLWVTLPDMPACGLKDPSQLVGYTGRPSAPSRVLLRHNGLHVEVVLDGTTKLGRLHHGGVSDVVVEAAITAILDMEDSVAVVDADDKSVCYQNLASVMRGDLQADLGGGKVRRIAGPRGPYMSPNGRMRFTLPGRTLAMVRNVGLSMYTDMVTVGGKEVPEHFVDAMATALCAKHDLARPHEQRNSQNGSVYVVKPKMHGPEAVQGSSAGRVLRVGWPLLQHFRHVYSLVANTDITVQLDSPFYRIAELCLLQTSKKRRRVLGKGMLSELAQVSDRNYGSYLQCLASAILHVDRLQRQIVESTVAGSVPPLQLLEYEDVCRHDETPIALTRAEFASFAQLPVGGQQIMQTATVGQQIAHAVPTRPFSKHYGRFPSKALQSESTFGMLVDHGEFIMSVVGSTLTMPQLVDRTSGESLLYAERCKESTGTVAMLESIHGLPTHCFPEFARRLRVNQRRVREAKVCMSTAFAAEADLAQLFLVQCALQVNENRSALGTQLRQRHLALIGDDVYERSACEQAIVTNTLSNLALTTLPDMVESMKKREYLANSIVIVLDRQDVVVYRMRIAFLRHMNRIINNDAMKDLVDDCSVLVELTGFRAAVLENGGGVGDGVMAELIALFGGRADEQNRAPWHCIGNQSWNPYRPTFQMMRSKVAQGRFRGYFGFADLDPSMVWKARWHQADDENQFLPKFAPGHVVATPFSESPDEADVDVEGAPEEVGEAQGDEGREDGAEARAGQQAALESLDDDAALLALEALEEELVDHAAGDHGVPLGGVGEPSVRVDLPSGWVQFSPTDGRFQATRADPRHQWIEISRDFATRADHRAVFMVMTIPRADREAARGRLMARAGGPEVVARERPRGTPGGEPEGPINVPMGW